MKKVLLRAVISIVIFFLILLLAEPLVTTLYNEVAQMVCYLAAVVGAGCYWIGSRD